jgi:hypothetical protein
VLREARLVDERREGTRHLTHPERPGEAAPGSRHQGRRDRLGGACPS